MELKWKEVFSGYDIQHRLPMALATLVVVQRPQGRFIMHVIKQKGVHSVVSGATDEPVANIDEAKQMVLEAYVDLMDAEIKALAGGYEHV